MFKIGESYKFKIKNPESEKGFIYYTGEIMDIYEDQISLITIKNEKISFHMREILKSKEGIE